MSEQSPADQATISREIEQTTKAYYAAGTTETRPRLDYAPYRSSILRHPTKSPVQADPEGIVVLLTTFGGTRIVDILVGDPLPRIC